MALSTITPPSKNILVKTGTVTRSDTSAKDLFGLPKGATILFSVVQYNTASDAGTTAVVEAGYVGDLDAIANGVNAKASPDLPTVSSGAAVGSSLTEDKIVTGIYAESGTASTTGGPFNISVFYTVG